MAQRFPPGHLGYPQAYPPGHPPPGYPPPGYPPPGHPPPPGYPPPGHQRGANPPHQGPARQPLGVRGAPSGPRSDLSQADTSAITHNLYVKVVPAGDPDKKSQALTLDMLRYIHDRLVIFKQMGIIVKVNKVTPRALQDQALRSAMVKKGITNLPALKTTTNIYIGLNAIKDLYERNIEEFRATNRRGEKPVEGAAPDDDDLDVYYRDEMTFERAEEDAQETGIGQTDDMMDAYRRMMERREASESTRRSSTGRRAAAATQVTQDRRAPPAQRQEPPRRPPAASARPDNVGGQHRAPRPQTGDPDDDEINETITRLAADIDDQTRERAFSGGGNDEDENSVQDDLMERAFYGRSQSSDA